MSQSGSGRCVSMRSTHLQLLSFGVALLAVATLISPAGALGATLSFNPVADGFTRSDAAATSNGTTNRTSVRSSTSQIRNTYMRFNVVVPAGEAIQSATLVLYSSTGGSNVDLRDVASDTWTESGLTWNSAPVYSTAIAAHVGSIARGKTSSFNATSIVTAGGPASMALTTTSSTTTSFNSREASKSTRPKLVVVTAAAGLLPPAPAPEPAPAPAPPPPPADTTAPQTDINSSPASPTTATTASFSFSGSDDVTAPSGLAFQCSYDGGSYQACSSIKTYSPVPAGTRSFAVRAVDDAGNVDSTPATDTWQVDAPPADTSAPSAPSTLLAVPGNASVVLTWLPSLDDVGVTGYRVFRGSTQVGTPTGLTFTDTGLTNGTAYTYSVRAVDAAGNVSAPSNNANATPVAPPISIGAWAWDARSAPLDPSSSSLAARVTANARTPNMAMTDWAVATVDAGSGDPEYSIPRTDQGGSITVRIPLGTRPDPSDDGHLTVRDVERNIETDFWQARYNATTRRISTTSAAVTFTLGVVNAGSGWTGNAANTPLRRGLITPEDLKAAMDASGSLPYTLQFGIPNIAQGSPRYPAAHNVPTGDFSSVVEGTWVRLDPAYDVESSGLPAWQKVIARTLQTRGAINRDNSGTLSFYGRNPLNGEAQWSVAGLSGASAGFSSSFPWSRLQVLAPPAR